MRVAGSLDVSESIKKSKEEEQTKEQTPEIVEETFDPGAKPWMLHGLLILTIVLYLTIGMLPSNLGAVEDRAYDSYWQAVHDDIQERVLVQYEQLPDAEKARLIQTQYLEAKRSAEHAVVFEEEVSSIKRVYADDRGVLYPYSGYGLLLQTRESTGYGKILNAFSAVMRIFTTHLERGLALYPLFIGLMSIIVVYLLGRIINTYAGPIAAFVLAAQPRYFTQLHYGNIGFSWSQILIAAGIALVSAYLFAKLLPTLAKMVDGLHFGIKRTRLGAVILLMVIMGAFVVDNAWSLREYTPPVDDSVLEVARYISTTLSPQEKLLIWTHWEDIYEYYANRKPSGLSEADIGRAFLGDGDCAECTYTIVSEDYIGRSTKMAQAAGIDDNVSVSSITPCMEVNDAIVCGGNFFVRNGEVKQRDQHPAAFYNYVGNKSVVHYEDSRVDYAFVLYEDDGLYAFLVEEQHADSKLFTMLARGKVEGQDLIYSTTFPRQIVVYSRNNTTA